MAAWASLGPTPVALCSSSKQAFSSSSPNPYSVSESSRTTRLVESRAASPRRRPDSVAGVQWTSSPTPPTSTTAASRVMLSTRPATLAIIGRPARASILARAASILAWAPPRQTWQMASASASAASAGLGGASSRSSRVTMAATCALSARPLPETAALTSLGVCSMTGMPNRAAHTIATAPAWAVPMTVRTLCWLNTRSTATASGW